MLKKCLKDLVGNIFGPILYNNVQLSHEPRLASKDLYEGLLSLPKEELKEAIKNATPIELSFSDWHFLQMGLKFEEKEAMIQGYSKLSTNSESIWKIREKVRLIVKSMFEVW